MEDETKEIVVDIYKCARCQGDHPNLKFLPLHNAPDDTSHYAMCPVKNQPILMKVNDAG